MLAGKLRAATAGAEGLPIEDLFSTYLYTGNGSTQTITNGIDLAGEGGLVWIKHRTNTQDHTLYDTERGVDKYLGTASNAAEATDTNSFSEFLSDGFTVASGRTNGSSIPFVSWTFRKAPRFFDVVTYTGTAVGARNIAHNLGVTPGMIVIKRTDSASALGWIVHHRSLGFSNYMWINGTNGSAVSSNYISNADESTFQIGGLADVNASGGQFVAYLFAHNDGDGEFGPNGDQDIIKCGSYVGGAGGVTSVDLGFEPQWVLIKKSSSTGDWILLDVMRGFSLAVGDPALFPSTSGAESVPAFSRGKPTATGFVDESVTSGATYIYMAIRRGPMKTPESGTEVFDISTASNPAPRWKTSPAFPVDFAIYRDEGGLAGVTRDNFVADRLRGEYALKTTVTAAESNSYAFSGSSLKFDYMDGFFSTSTSGSTQYAWMFRRAPGFFDVVTYTGTGVARTISHNLGVEPGCIVIKRTNDTSNWITYHRDLSAPATRYLRLNTTDAEISAAGRWNDTLPTSTEFSLGTSADVNFNGGTYVAYLFATLPGISKVGSYTGNGSSQTIDCGFTTGARFVLIKRADSAGDWYVWDTVRGIVTGNDPHLSVNTTAAEVTTDDSIDPDSSGFIVNQVAATDINVSSASYIYLAIS